MLHKLTNGKPISTLDKFKINTNIDLSYLEIAEEIASLDGGSFVNCSFNSLRFSNTSITNCTFTQGLGDFQKLFRNVRVDGTGFNYCFEQELSDFRKHNEHDLSKIQEYFYFTEVEPINLVKDKEIKR